jgi:hypothetical protein
MRRGLVALVAAVGLALAAPAAASVRHTADQADDLKSSEQVHVMYVVPSDGADRGLDANGTLESSVASWQEWLRGQTGGRGMKLDTASGALDVTFVRLGVPGEEIAQKGVYARDEIEKQLADVGFKEPNKVYAVYYDGPIRADSCGAGAWPPVLPGRVAALYLRGELSPRYQPCDSNPFAGPGEPPGYVEYSMLHEVLHTIGFVPKCAPHQTRGGHVSDSPTDLMYAGDEPWAPSVLDFGRDDYFAAGRHDCLDLAKSRYLEGNPSTVCVAARSDVKRATQTVRDARAALSRARTKRARQRARSRLSAAKRRLSQASKRVTRFC